MTQLPAQIGPYTITREIGRGGMGVVYLARDTKLDRDVAIKTLPDELSDDPERLSRFEREAKTLASLNHPNIASIYGLEEVDGRRYLILEHVPGETLDSVLNQGPMPVTEALPVAQQIAEAVEAAHEKGIIHRDLKPANIKFAEGDQVKVLDFGLAKAFEDKVSTASDIAASPTYLSANTPTMPGVVLGTAGYLSPEQARGRMVDKRTDIFSFGCVLYEMLAGRTVFPGETVTDSLGATLHKEPIWDDLPSDTPPTVLLLLRRCLTKDRRRRLHDIADARVEIEEAISDPTSSSLDLASCALIASADRASRGRRRRPVVLAATSLGGLAAGVALTLGGFALRPEPARPLERLSITLPHRVSEVVPRNVLDVSADGRRLLYSAIGEDQLQLFVRAVDQREPRSLAGTEDVFVAGLSPDGEWAAFFSRMALKRVSLRGGPSTTIAEVGAVNSLSWCDDGSIYFTVWDKGLMRVGENGGEPEILVAAADQRDLIYRGTEALPGGEVVLYVTSTSFRSALSINLYDQRTGQSSQLVSNGSSPRFVRPGHLLFTRDSTLMAAPFDSSRATLNGQAVPVVENVRTAFGFSSVDVSDAGVLFHLGGGLQEAGVVLQSLRATGEPEPLSARSALMGRVRLAPDGRRIAVVLIPEGDSTDRKIWTLDIERDQMTVLTTEPGSHRMPCWSPDGSFIYYLSDAETSGEASVVSRRSADGGDPQIMLTTMVRSALLDVLPDDRGLLIAQAQEAEFRDDLMIVRFGETPVAEPWLATAADEDTARISPNGRWVAYQSDESGDDEIYVRPLEGSGARWAVSLDGGRDPFWSVDGRILYFIEERAGSATVMAAEVTSGNPERNGVETGPFRTAVPIRWTVLPPLVRPGLIEAFPDGERLMVTGPIVEQRDDPLEILVTRNFIDELERVARPSPR